MTHHPRNPRLALVAVLLLACAAPVAAQIGTEPAAWEPEHRELAGHLGDAAVITQATATAIVDARAWHDGDRRPAYRDVCAISAAMLTTTTIKHFVHEWRPDGSDDKSTPSGHATALAALTGWNYTFSISLAVFGGVSRVNANVHHPKDVARGWLIGGLAQGGCTALVNHFVKPPV